MLKLTLPNYHCTDGSYRESTVFDAISNNLIRIDKEGIVTNSHGKKLQNRPTSGSNLNWLKKKDSVVIINDNREEVNVVGMRGLLTTSFIIEECLQINRGYQNYEHERNKFYTKDNDVSNNRKPTLLLNLLDAIWFMKEKNADALEIMSDEEDLGQNNCFKSKRYSDIIEAHKKRITKFALDYLPKKWEAYEKEMLLQDDNTIDWSKSFRERDFDDKGLCSSYTTEGGIMSRYYSDMQQRVEEDKLTITMKEWLDKFMLRKQKYSPSDSVKLLMTHFGLAEIDLVDSITDTTSEYAIESVLDCVLYGSVPSTTKVVEKSKFKRNHDWCLEVENLVRGEALKLRRSREEGTYDE